MWTDPELGERGTHGANARGPGFRGPGFGMKTKARTAPSYLEWSPVLGHGLSQLQPWVWMLGKGDGEGSRGDKGSGG